MFEALCLYAQFLKELPSMVIEQDAELKVVLGYESCTVFIIDMPRMSGAPTFPYEIDFIPRVATWFDLRGLMVRVARFTDIGGLNTASSPFKLKGHALPFVFVESDT